MVAKHLANSPLTLHIHRHNKFPTVKHSNHKDASFAPLYPSIAKNTIPFTIITALQKGGLLWGYKPMRKAGASRRSPSLMFRRIAFAALTQPHKGAKLWLPCKRIFVFSHTQLIYCLIMHFLFSYVLTHCCLI